MQSSCKSNLVFNFLNMILLLTFVHKLEKKIEIYKIYKIYTIIHLNPMLLFVKFETITSAIGYL